MKKKTKFAAAVCVIFYLLLSIYKIANRDIGYDEAWNYYYFINTPAWFPFVLFNTYPLFHFSAHFFNYLPFDPTINIRLSAVLAGLTFCWLLVFILNKKFSKLTTFLVILLSCCSYIFAAFSCFAKGIMFCMPLSLVMFYSAYKIMETKNNKRYYLLYILAGILNIASIPTAVIFCCSITLFSFFYKNQGEIKRKKVMRLILANMLTIGMGSLFYITTLINPGAARIFFKPSAETAATGFEVYIQRAVFFFEKTGCLFFGNEFGSFLCLVAGIAFYFFIKQRHYKNMLLFSITAIILSVFIAVYTDNALPDRAFAFLFIPCLVTTAIAVESCVHLKITEWAKYLSATAISVLLIMMGIFNTRTFLNPPGYEHEAKTLSNELMQQQVSTCYIQSSSFFIYYPMMLYYYTINGRQWKMTTWEENSTRYKAFDIADNYDCIITDTANNVLPGYKKLYESNDFWVYIRNDSKH